jgi:hypothetical protein
MAFQHHFFLFTCQFLDLIFHLNIPHQFFVKIHTFFIQNWDVYFALPNRKWSFLLKFTLWDIHKLLPALFIILSIFFLFPIRFSWLDWFASQSGIYLELGLLISRWRSMYIFYLRVGSFSFWSPLRKWIVYLFSPFFLFVRFSVSVSLSVFFFFFWER